MTKQNYSLTDDSIANRKGTFTLKLYNFTFDAINFDAYRAVMAHCLILRCEHVLMTGNLEYHAISKQFDEVSPGEVIPEYTVVITRKDDQHLVEFKRC